MPPPIQQTEKIAALADLERDASKAKEIAARLGVSEITLYAWRKAWGEGRDLDDAAPPPPPEDTEPPKPKPHNKGGYREAYPKEVRDAALKAYFAKEGTAAEIAERFGMRSEAPIYNWAMEAKKARPVGYKKETPGRSASRTPDERIQLARQYIAGKVHITKFAKQYGVSAATVYTWIKELKASQGGVAVGKATSKGTKQARYETATKYQLASEAIASGQSVRAAAERLGVSSTRLGLWMNEVRTGKLKPPPQRSAPQSRGVPFYSGQQSLPMEQSELVDLHSGHESNGSGGSALALSSQRVETKDQVIARQQAEIERLKRKLRVFAEMVVSE